MRFVGHLVPSQPLCGPLHIEMHAGREVQDADDARRQKICRRVAMPRAHMRPRLTPEMRPCLNSGKRHALHGGNSRSNLLQCNACKRKPTVRGQRRIFRSCHNHTNLHSYLQALANTCQSRGDRTLQRSLHRAHRADHRKIQPTTLVNNVGLRWHTRCPCEYS